MIFKFVHGVFKVLVEKYDHQIGSFPRPGAPSYPFISRVINPFIRVKSPQLPIYKAI